MSGHGGDMSADAIRGYVRTLRVERKVSQEKMSEAIKMALRTYKAWELGEIKDIKTPYLIRAILFLRGTFDHIAGLTDNATTEEGETLARSWVVNALLSQPDETPEEADRINRLLALLASGVPAREAAVTVLREQ